MVVIVSLSMEIELTKTKKQKPAANELGFGKYYTDHMFMMDYDNPEEGWHNPRIIPYQPISLDPAAKVFHYGQTVFEGMKAYRTSDERILLFRPHKNFKRLNLSNDRIDIPQIDEEFALEALKQLIQIDQDWIPTEKGTSLYIRPFIIATEASLGASTSTSYQFIIILSPVGSYYPEGIKPVRIYVESEYVRAVKGGTGMAKTAGNYASGLKAHSGVAGNGFAQVLWLDGIERKYIEEVGSMNVFFKIDGKVVTPALTGSILDGVTRNSILQLLKHWNIPTEERLISIDELYEAYTNGTLEESFGTGTAAVISPIGELQWQDKKMVINEGNTGELSARLYNTLTGIQNGEQEDVLDWMVEVK